MVRTVTQSTFDEVLQQNMEDLELSREEAVIETINQFKAQGCDLSHIITEPNCTLVTIINNLKEFETSDGKSSEKLLEYLTQLKAECDKGIQYRVQAANTGAYDLIINVFSQWNSNREIQLLSLKTIIALTTKQPDILDMRGTQIILNNLSEDTDPEIQKLALKWCRESCVMHEMNRQKFVDLNIVNKLSILLRKTNFNSMKELLAVFRVLILDDDVRVEFGRAHEHARIIAAENLDFITRLLEKFHSDDVMVMDLMSTISAFLVRAEFCTFVDEAGGLDSISKAMIIFIENEKVTTQCFKLIKALSGSDETKAHIIQKNFAPIISNSLNIHKRAVKTAIAGLTCIAALSLRSSANSKALFEAGIPDVIVDIMKLFPDDESIQKSASWAIRNMVSRSRFQNEKFLELGIEEILQNNLKKFKKCEYDIKAALRDLGCKVELKEEWTGRGGQLTSQFPITENVDN